MALETYDPGKVVVIFAGKTITGLVSIKVSRDEDTWKKTADMAGNISRTRNRNRAGGVELGVSQTSSANDVLSAQARLDELTGTGAAPLLIKDLSGRTVVKADNAWITKPADAEFAMNDQTARPWKLDTGPLDIVIGGNSVV